VKFFEQKWVNLANAAAEAHKSCYTGPRIGLWS